MIYGTTVLRGATAPSNNYFNYRGLMMNGFGSMGATSCRSDLNCPSGQTCISGVCKLQVSRCAQGGCKSGYCQTAIAAGGSYTLYQCCPQVGTAPCYNLTSQAPPLVSTCSASNPTGSCTSGKVCVGGQCVNPGTGTCGKICTSPCSTGQPEDCCHYECSPGVTPPPPVQYTQYPYVNTADGSGVAVGSDLFTTKNVLIAGGLAVGAFLLGHYVFKGKTP